MDTAAAMFRSLADRWASVFVHPQELLRARPAPDTWCPVEYAQHTVFAIGAIEWAARQFVQGQSPDWTQEPQDLTGEFEHDIHDCGRFEVAATLAGLESVARSMAAVAMRLTPEEQARTADYGGGLVINTAAVVRH